MNAIKQSIVEKYNQEITKMAQLRDAVDLLPDTLVELPNAILYTGTARFRVDLPLTPTAFREARAALGREWKRGSHSWQAENGDCYFTFTHKAIRVDLTLCLQATMKGATCERRQVGEKIVPIYETVCH